MDPYRVKVMATSQPKGMTNCQKGDTGGERRIVRLNL